VALRDVPEDQKRPLLPDEDAGSVRVFARRRDAFDRVRNALRHGPAAKLRRRYDDSGECAHEARERGLDVGCTLEVELVALGIHEAHCRASQCRFADAVREYRHFHAQVRADEQNTLLLLELGNRAAEPRPGRIRRLVAKVAAPQTVIETLRLQMRTDPAQ
jgi:hypothetical protein